MSTLQLLRRKLITLFLLIIQLMIYGQESYCLRGIITDEFNHPLVGASVVLQNENKLLITDKNGSYNFTSLQAGIHILYSSFLGYYTRIDTVNLRTNINFEIKLQPNNTTLHEIIVTDKQNQLLRADLTLSSKIVDKKYLQQHASGSLMQSLNRLPGVSSIDIGSGQSKPVIRGLGFNRIAVAENGIKHEAQEWGNDHGLEIDQFNIDKVEIIKGPASIMYGANAIGGIIDVKQNTVPGKHSTSGSVLMHLQSNNQYWGTSLKLSHRGDKLYWKIYGTYADYGDYVIPTDSIVYMTYNIKLKNNKLRNTAGRERNGGFTLGYLTENFSSQLNVSNNFSRSGFFANAHGLEIRNSNIDYDHSARDIDLPSQQVNHFKILSNNIIAMKDYKLNIDLGYQNNFRQEFSEKVAHGYMPIPPDTLERLFNKHTLSANLKLEIPKHNLHKFVTGINVGYQQNNTGGWGFILPNFRSANAGVYIYDNIQFSQSNILHAGIRYDLGRLQTNSYFDWYKTPQDNGIYVNIQRASALKKYYGNLSWAIGLSKVIQNSTLKINFGKSYRIPTAKELASNGINYHMYRFEKGDSTLKAEESYQFDISYKIKNKKFSLEISPFVNYFPTYIYLNPTSKYFEAQQVYFYRQSSVFRSGGEIDIAYELNKVIQLNIDAEYIYASQLNGNKKGYTLPFSPPFTSNVELIFKPDDKGIFTNPEFGTLLKLTATQTNIVPPEKITPGYILWNLYAGANIKIGNKSMKLSLQLNNVMNSIFYDHTSFYRLIEVPGQGRNFIISTVWSI